MNHFFTILFAAVFAENLLFSRMAGWELLLRMREKPSGCLLCGAYVTIVSTLSAGLAAALRLLPFFAAHEALLLFMSYGILLGVSFLVIFLSGKLPAKYQLPADAKIPAMTDTALPAAVILALSGAKTVPDALLYGLLSGVSMLLAMFLYLSMTSKMRFCEFPKPFRGVPAALLSAAIACLAFSGFEGIAFSVLS